MNNSSDRGYLTPTASSQQDDIELERSLSRWVRGVSGLDAGRVLLRWLPEQPHIPAAGDNWCSVGVMTMSPDDNPAFVNQTDDSTELWRHELIEVMVSFYGPNSQRYAGIFTDGIGVTQNNAELNQSGLSLVTYSAIIAAPELINNQWIRRYDQHVTLRRKVVREYAIRSIIEAPTQFFGD